MHNYDFLRLVHVRAYKRMRFGRIEYVCEHYRSYPCR
nr:MAG TPA: hypothetical protein [Caudoviricetes sp.]DAV43277.1 MAG TPA: hypothetical protein [Caudoviricetes sp.]